MNNELIVTFVVYSDTCKASYYALYNGKTKLYKDLL